MKDSIRIIYVGMLLLAGTVFGQTTLTGYTNSVSLPQYSVDEKFDKLEQWLQLMNTDLDTPPSQMETELYRDLIRSEGGGRMTASSSTDGWGNASGAYAYLDRIKKTKDLAWLPGLLDRADSLLSTRMPAGTYSPTIGHGVEYDSWIASHWYDELQPLLAGFFSLSIAETANFILDHPELYNQTAPTNSTIPIVVPDTYYERAKFYLTELKATYEVFELCSMWWEFDTTAQAGWLFMGSNDTGEDLAARYPNGIPIADIRTTSNNENIPMRPYNRTFYWLAGYYQIAKGLHQIDQVEGTTQHTAFYNQALDRVEKSLNWWRYHRRENIESAPYGTAFRFPYSASQDSDQKYEDTTHFEMDVLPLSHLTPSGFFTQADLEGISGTIFSRWFDRESHVYFSSIEPHLNLDGTTGLPKNYYWWWGPQMSDWIGRYGPHEQAQGQLTIALELFKEKMRRAASDPIYKDAILQRNDTIRTRNLLSPFEIYELKMARHERGLTSTGNMNAPVVTAVSPSANFTLTELTALGTEVGSVTATDADAGQQIFYWISGGNIGNRFKINPTNGAIRVNNYYPLNDEDGGAVTPLEVTIMDTGIPVRSVTTNITITLDNTRSAPQVAAGQTGRFTPSLMKGDPVLKIDATDSGPLKFYMAQAHDLFEVDPAGTVRMKKQGGQVGTTYEISVGVIQDTTNLPLSKTAKVQIVCHASYLSLQTSVTNGTAPLDVQFDATHSAGKNLQSVHWDFGDGSVTNTLSVLHRYDRGGVTNTLSVLAVDEAGILDRATATISTQGTAGQPQDGLLALYRFSEGSGSLAQDSSGLGNHAPLSGDGYDASGVEGIGFRTRDHSLEIPASVYGQLNNEITFSFYAKGDPDFYYVNYPLAAYNNSGDKILGLHLPWGNYSWDAGINNRLSVGLPIPDNGVWTHWTFTKNATTGLMQMYTNGVLAAEGNGNWQSLNGIATMRIGRNIPIGGNYRGILDEIRIYNQALNATQVAALYQDSPLTRSYQLSYTTDSQGQLKGEVTQTVAYGQSGSFVLAEPVGNSTFAQWSDGRTDNPRMDLNVTEDLSVTAIFSQNLNYVGAEILTLIPDHQASSPPAWGSAFQNTVNDPFLFSVETPASPLPQQSWDPTVAYHAQLGEGVDAELIYAIDSSQATPDLGDFIVVDLYGRDSFTERALDIDIQLYRGGFGGTLIEEVTGLSISTTDPYHVRATLQIKEAFDTLAVIGHDSTLNDGENAFTLMEIRATRIPVDTDGDALSDEWERILGTDPNDANSSFRITDATKVNGRIRLHWPSATGATYKVWQSDDLTNWTQLRDWANATATPNETYEVDPTQTNRFYKIEARPAP